ncbi:hypothetical protein BOTBODRAFT_618809 [Botryobasidium botryosum FD-172 SS1]|uniref:Uncharacterized protein n=1 Tax=Botryobasidium botryosum (strain FD-172 SS1) TaxID=930990 RepID=A0A067NBS8_BOTB1|nr:hypothetical protein BOTBODRAFT_618809 [Botryobasidium botryosum FD-172 SS1]
MRELWKVRPAQIPPLGEREGWAKGIASRAGTGVSGLLKIKEHIAIRVLSSYGVSRRDSQKAGVVEAGVLEALVADAASGFASGSGSILATSPSFLDNISATTSFPGRILESSSRILKSPQRSYSFPTRSHRHGRIYQHTCHRALVATRVPTRGRRFMRLERNGLQSPGLVTCVIVLGYTLSTWHQVEALAAKVESQCVDIADFKTYMTTNWKVGSNQKDAIGCIVRELIVDPTCHSYMELWATQAQACIKEDSLTNEAIKKSIAFVLTFGAHFVAGYIKTTWGACSLYVNNLLKADAELYGVAGSYLLKIAGGHPYDTSPLFADPAAAAKTVPASFSAVPCCLYDF